MSTAMQNTTDNETQSSSVHSVQQYDMLFSIVGCLLLSPVGLLSNIFILIIISRDKSLQSSCFLLICLDCVCSMVFDCGVLVLAPQQAVSLATSLDPIRPRWLCYSSTILLIIMGIQGNNLAICAVGLDRLISIISPGRYQQTGGNHVWAIWIFCLTYSALSAMTGVLAMWSTITQPIQCSPADSLRSIPPSYLAYFGLFNLMFSVLCVCLYGAMLITFKWRVKSIKDPRAAQAFLKHQQACMPTVKLLLIFYVITAVLPEIYVSTAGLSEMTSKYTARISCYLGPVKTAASLAQITALYFGSTKFRAGAKGVFGGQASNVMVLPAGAAGGAPRGAPN